MRALTRGERQASAGIIAGLVGLLCLLGASLGLNLKHAHDLDQLRQTIIHRCEARLAYDSRFVQSAKDDVAFYAELERITDAAPEPTSPQVRALYVEQRRALATVKANKQRIVDQGVIGNCNVYR